ncbi:MAG TPA: hypothetical protein VKZ75_09660 [Cyclobacteriaceae bacterium]|nr:hypothetical protein [Cyclobacteriaceae bacterium]
MIRILVVFFLLLAFNAAGQNQLLLLKRQEVLLRLNAGDDFVFRMKGSKEVRRTYINTLSDTAVVTHRDTVPYHLIDRVYFRRSTFVNRLGLLLVIGGAGYFLIDQLNNVVVKGNDARIDNSVAIASGTMVGVGMPMMLIGRNSRRVGGRIRLLKVTPESPLYRSFGPKGYVSPYIPR